MTKNDGDDIIRVDLIDAGFDAGGEWITVYEKDLDEAVVEVQHKARQEAAQEAYLEALAAECGEGEVARGIRTKFGLEGYKDD